MFDPTPTHRPQDYAARRGALLDKLREQNAAMLLPGGQLQTRSNDTEFPFRPDSDFYFLSGMGEPGGILALNPQRDEAFTLFVRPRDAKAETWSGRRIGPAGAVQEYGADAAYPLSKFQSLLPAWLDGVERIYLPLQNKNPLERRIRRACNELRRQNRRGRQAPSLLAEAQDLLGDMRLIKDPAGLKALRQAVSLSAQGHIKAMQHCRPGGFEYEIEALLAYEFRRHGSSGPGYGSIVAGGDNATILHYVDNQAPLVEGQLLLIDAGAEWEYFSGDITRTFPISGRFSPAQRDLYEIVLRANEAGIAACEVGQNIDEVHQRCVRVLCEGLSELKLCSGSIDEIIESESYLRYYMHKTSHWLGLDVHDLGPYTRDGQAVPFAPDMVLTVEPALYIAQDDENAPAELRGTGIRIEDDIRITPDGPENFSQEVPKTVAGIEELMREAHS